MINDFLFNLVNDADADFGRIPMPSAPVRVYAKSRRAVQEAIIGGSNARDRVKSAVALTLMLRHSMLAKYESIVDARTTYDDGDLFAELIGGVDDITTPPGVVVTYAAGAAAPSEEVWTATRLPNGKLGVVSSLGQEIVEPAFSASAAAVVPLRHGDITMNIIGIPPIGSKIMISRNSKFRYSISAAARRLSLVGESALLEIVPTEVGAVLRNGFVLTTTTRLVAAAIGVAYART